MKYYSEVTKTLFDDEKALKEAEAKVEKERQEKEIAVKKKADERTARAKEVEAAYEAFCEAQKVATEKRKAYQNLLEAFLADYKQYHATIRSGSSLIDDMLFDFFRML